MYEPLSQIFSKLSFFPVLALGCAAALAWVRIGYRKKLYLSWWWYTLFSGILFSTYFACYIFEKSARESSNLEVNLRIIAGPRKFNEIAIVYKNNSSSTMLVYNMLYRIDGADSFVNNRVPVTLNAGSERSMIMGEMNNPSVQRAATVNINFRFADGYLSKDYDRILKCDFSLSSGMSGGAEIPPENCQQVSENTISPEAIEQVTKLFSQNYGRFVVSVPDDEGDLFRLGSSPGWVFTYTPSNKQASLVRGQLGHQIGSVIEVEDTPNHIHRFEGIWDDAAREVYLTADGAGKWFKIPEDVWKKYSADSSTSAVD